MGIPMICKKPFRPGGSGSPMLAPGSQFEAPGQSLARTYRAMGWAEDAPAQEPEPVVEPPKRAYTRKVIEADLPTTQPSAAEKPKRTYQRRDLKSED